MRISTRSLEARKFGSSRSYYYVVGDRGVFKNISNFHRWLVQGSSLFLSCTRDGVLSRNHTCDWATHLISRLDSSLQFFVIYREENTCPTRPPRTDRFPTWRTAEARLFIGFIYCSAHPPPSQRPPTPITTPRGRICLAGRLLKLFS